jgi:hypothetical protein
MNCYNSSSSSSKRKVLLLPTTTSSPTMSGIGDSMDRGSPSAPSKKQKRFYISYEQKLDIRKKHDRDMGPKQIMAGAHFISSPR